MYSKQRAAFLLPFNLYGWHEMGMSSPAYHPGPKGDELIGYLHQLARISLRRLTLAVCPVRAGGCLKLMYIPEDGMN